MHPLPLLVAASTVANQFLQTQAERNSGQPDAIPLKQPASAPISAKQGRGTFYSRICKVPEASSVFQPLCSRNDHSEEPVLSTQIGSDSVPVNIEHHSPMELLMYYGFEKNEAEKIIKQYEIANIPINTKTVIRNFQDKNCIGELEPFGSGFSNNVFKVTYQLGPEKKEFRGVFKEQKVFGFWEALQRFGPIDAIAGKRESEFLKTVAMGLASPYKYGNRNIATSRVSNNLLKWDVIPHTEYGWHKGKLGLVMELADGEIPYEFDAFQKDITYHPMGKHFKGLQKEIEKNPDILGTILRLNGLTRLVFEDGRVFIGFGKPNQNIDYSQPKLLQKIMRLQVIDHITGQVDRNPTNWRIASRNSGKDAGAGREPSVKGIDNDMSFGPKIRKVNDLYYVPDSCAVTLPPFIDTETYDDVMQLNVENLESELTGLLTSPEIEAAKHRLLDVQRHFGKLYKDGDIIELSQLPKMIDDSRLNPQNSYIARERTLSRFS